MSSLNSSTSATVIQNDQQAINAAYQVADFALVERNIRDQQRILPVDVIQELSHKGLGGIRIAKKYGGAQVSIKRWHMFSAFYLRQMPVLVRFPRTNLVC